MSFPIESYSFPTQYQFAPVDHEPGMCLSDSPPHPQVTELPAHEEDAFLPSGFEEEANTLDPELRLPTSEIFTSADAREYLQNRLMTYRMTLEVPDSPSAETEENPVEELSSPLSSPQSAISAEQAAMTEDEKIDAALEAYIDQSRDPLLAWL